MILLQILDEGTITDSQGRKVDFRVCPTSRSNTGVLSFCYTEYHHLPHEQHWWDSFPLLSLFGQLTSLR